MNREEAKAYARGYRAGLHRNWSHLKRLIALAKVWRAMAASGDPSQTCSSCRRWTRGGEKCFWGHCAADFDFSVEPRMWAETRHNIGGLRIATSEEFGCVGWLPRTSVKQGG